jgi:hypothetical protein
MLRRGSSYESWPLDLVSRFEDSIEMTSEVL